jgi:hypothetical protein
LASSTASCSVAKVRADSTGPKISSRQMRMRGWTPVNTAGRLAGQDEPQTAL